MNESRVPTGVIAVVFHPDHRDRVVMLRRQGAHGAGTWTCPGGWVEWGESPRAAAIREVYEEIGLPVENPRFVTMTNDYFEGEGIHAVTLWFIVPYRLGHTMDICEPEKMDRLEWVQVDRLPDPLFLPWQHVDMNLVKTALVDYV